MTGTLLELRDKYLKEAIEYIDNGDINFFLFRDFPTGDNLQSKA